MASVDADIPMVDVTKDSEGTSTVTASESLAKESGLVGTTEDTTKDGEVPKESGEDKEKMRKAYRQIEFYFADSNLPYDKFMWTLHTKTPEHWVPIATVASFKRMRQFSSLGIEWVTDALRLSDELEVDESGTNVRRRTEVQEPRGQFERSIYAKGFGEETPDLQRKLEEFFEKYGKTNAVRMRRGEKKEFKGSVFVEFTDIKSVDAFLNADPKPSWEGKELLIMTKEAYCDMKIKEKGLTGKAANHRKELINRRGFNAFKEMAKSSKSDSQKNKKPEVWLEFLGTKIRVHEDEEGNGYVKNEDVPFVKGASLKFDGARDSVNFADIKSKLKEKFDRAPFIKYTKGEDHGLVGFDHALTEEEISFVRETLKTLDGKEVTWSVAPEEDDKAFQLERASFAAKSALSHSSSRGGRGGKAGRGGRGGKGARGGARGGDRKAEKAANGPEAGKDSEEQAGDKRKRAVEPDGGPNVGVRGNDAPPAIQTAKKVKTETTAGTS